MAAGLQRHGGVREGRKSGARLLDHIVWKRLRHSPNFKLERSDSIDIKYGRLGWESPVKVSSAYD